VLPRRGDLERFEYHRLLPGRVDGLLCRIDRLLRRKRSKDHDTRKRRDKRCTLRDVSPHVVRRSSQEPTRLPDRVTIEECVRPRMDALVLTSWDQARGGGPTA